MPSFLRGMINLRGSVVPVIDLQARFGRGKAPSARRAAT
jgi:purine-binding chemotaxis protein CheW